MTERATWMERRRRSLRSRWRLIGALEGAPRWLVAAAVVAAIVAGLLPVALILAGGSMTARIANAVGAGGSEASLEAVYRAFAVLIGLFLAAEVMVPVQSRVRFLVQRRVDGVARGRAIGAALAGTDMRHLHDPTFTEAMGQVRGLITYSATPGWGATGMIGILRDYLTGIAAAVVLLRYHAGYALLAIAVAAILRQRWRRSIIRIIEAFIKGNRSFREARYFTELGLGRTAAHEIRLFGLPQWIRRRINAAGVRGWTPTWRERVRGAVPQTTVQVVLTLLVAVPALVWAARATAEGDLGIGDLVVFVPALFAVLAKGGVFDDDVAVEYGAVTLDALRTLERFAADAVASESGRRHVPRDTPPSVELRGVSFRYPGGTDQVLRDVDLDIPSGTSAALVGMNGAGKTTLVRLLCGLYVPGTGSVLMDGVDLREVDLDVWHRRIAPMFQEFVRLPGTVAENASIGAVEHMDDAEGIAAALDEAGVTRFARRMPEGTRSLLATRYADGTDVSGGQWQRLGIARALFAIRTGARFLLLDEPTSNLDTSSEERLIQRLVEQMRGTATTLLVTHRLALARRTDRILVVERGRIVERGTHEELLRLDGRYAAAFGMQASLYPLEEAVGDG